MKINSVPHHGLWICCLAASMAGVGCNAIDSSKGLLTNAQPVAENGPMVTIEYRAEKQTPQAVRIPLEGENVHVQQALDKAGAWKKFNRAEIELSRQTPQGRHTKMAVTHDRGKRRIDPQCDYQIWPGDTLIVTEDPSTVVDDMLERVGPFGKKAHKKRPAGS